VGGLTTALARLAPEGPLPLLAASAVVAVVLVPVAAWLRRAVDRLVLGERADPLAVVDRVGAGLAAEHDDPVASMLEAVASAAEASYAVVRDPGGEPLAQVGVAGEPVLRLPLRHGGEDLGVLEVGAATGQRAPTARDLRIVTTLAPQLAAVVRSSRLTRDLAVARIRVTRATLAERDRLRRDLHDGLGPSLSGIALGLEAASTAYDTDPGSIPELLRRTRVEADAAVREIRRVLDGLRPSALDLHGLDGAVRDAASSLGMGLPGGPHLDVHTDLPPLLPPSIEEAAFRIAAESLTNVVRHSRADHCTVMMHRVNGDLRVQISDDGSGLCDGPRLGHGLDSMRRRAADVGGSLSIDPGDPTGTVVTAVLPLGRPG
jgi:signal transduction histidine kinase